MSPDPSKQDQRYTLLSEEPQSERQSPRKDCGRSTGWVVSLFAVTACLLSIASFAAGRHSVRGNVAHKPSSAPDPFDGEPPETVVLEFNQTFTGSSARTAQAWREVMPPRGGFFDYPAAGEGRATFSVYHQLHCLVRTFFFFFFFLSFSPIIENVHGTDTHGGPYLRRTAFAKATGSSLKRPSRVESCRSRRLDTWLLRRTCGIASTFCARASCVMPIRRWRLRMRRSGVSKGSGSDTNAWTGLD